MHWLRRRCYFKGLYLMVIISQIGHHKMFRLLDNLRSLYNRGPTHHPHEHSVRNAQLTSFLARRLSLPGPELILCFDGTFYLLLTPLFWRLIQWALWTSTISLRNIISTGISTLWFRIGMIGIPTWSSVLLWSDNTISAFLIRLESLRIFL